MCGIFGIVVDQKTPMASSRLINVINKLFKLSESRGKEAAGLALMHEKIHIYKQPIPASQMIKSKPYCQFMRNCLNQVSSEGQLNQSFSLIGHSRLVTNGVQIDNNNNQPVTYKGLVGIHNGIIVNADDLWRRHSELKRSTRVDSEVLLGLIDKHYQDSQDLFQATRETFNAIEGTASFAALFDNQDYLLLGTNTGSLYLCYQQANPILIFASEAHILEQVKLSLKGILNADIKQIKPYQGLLLNIKTFGLDGFSLKKNQGSPAFKSLPKSIHAPIHNFSNHEQDALDSMRRCSRCILPETMPFIRFNEQGICNYCENHRPIIKLGEEALIERIKPFRKNNGEPDCILAFSGGRDSSYGLHYLTNVLKMNPIAFTYDWGMVTDLARRNQARMCGQLGIEHILISADIKKKRKNIKKNILAWLKKPDLGTVPIFMAGDKQYISYPAALRKKTNTELVFYCRNQMEKTNFKTGFCGVNEAGKWYYEMSALDKVKIIAYYLRQYAANWSYINASLLDNLAGIYHSFFVDRTHYVQLFNYITWDEDSITATLRNEYNWEFATDTESSWRIGDGTAAFYNYIYYTVAGFSEIDTFRSNQVREGFISRKDALVAARLENQPRYDSLQEYARIIGFDCDEALKVINSMPKLYFARTPSKNRRAGPHKASDWERSSHDRT